MSTPGALFAEKDEAELAYLDLVPAGKIGFLDPQFVDISPVQATHVDYPESVLCSTDLGMPSGYRYIIKENVALWMSSGGGDLFCYHKAGPGAWSSLDYQHSGSRRELILGNLDLRFLLDFSFDWRQSDGCIARPGVTVQVSSTLVAVCAFFRVVFPACWTKHLSLPFPPALLKSGAGLYLFGNLYYDLVNLLGRKPDILDESKHRSPLL